MLLHLLPRAETPVWELEQGSKFIQTNNIVTITSDVDENGNFNDFWKINFTDGSAVYYDTETTQWIINKIREEEEKQNKPRYVGSSGPDYSKELKNLNNKVGKLNRRLF